MSNTKSFVDHVVDLLATIEPITCRPMFGGHGLSLDGMMFGIADDDQLFLKVDAESQPKFVAAGCKQFVYPSKNGPMTMMYYQPPPEALDDARELKPWYELAVGAALRKQAARQGVKARAAQPAKEQTASAPARKKAPAQRKPVREIFAMRRPAKAGKKAAPKKPAPKAGAEAPPERAAKKAAKKPAPKRRTRRAARKA